MSEDISPNKVSDKDKRRAEAIKSRLVAQGMGEDHAAKEALRQSLEEDHSGGGGGNSSGGQAQKDTEFIGSHRERADNEQNS